MRRCLLVLSALSLAAPACSPSRESSAQAGSVEGSRSPAAESAQDESAKPTDPSAIMKPASGRAPQQPPEAAESSARGVTGEVPQHLLTRMRADLGKRVGANGDAAEVLVAEAVMWSDGSLGCPEPGRMYTQAIVPGYRVVLRLDGRSYAYHASERGDFRLCERPLLHRAPPGREPVR
jgi:hypothetical protein